MAKWPMCVDVDFGDPVPRLPMKSVHMYLRTLGVTLDDLVGIAVAFDLRNQVARVSFKTQEIVNEFLEKNGGIKRAIIDEKNMMVTIRDSNEEQKFVRIGGYPHHGDLDLLESHLRKYGNVYQLRWEKYRVEEENALFPTLSSFVICTMSLKKRIPSYVNLGRYTLVVKYEGQPETCRICNQPGHKAYFCPTTIRRREAREASLAKQLQAVANVAEAGQEAGGINNDHEAQPAEVVNNDQVIQQATVVHNDQVTMEAGNNNVGEQTNEVVVETSQQPQSIAPAQRPMSPLLFPDSQEAMEEEEQDSSPPLPPTDDSTWSPVSTKGKKKKKNSIPDVSQSKVARTNKTTRASTQVNLENALAHQETRRSRSSSLPRRSK